MILIAWGAALVGFIHTLSPGHWLPIVMLAKAKKWSLKKSLFGALIAASGHIAVATALAIATAFIGAQFFEANHLKIEQISGVVVIIVGLAYAWYSRSRHSHCHGHGHHGPEIESKKEIPYGFLFTMSLAPCVSVLPVFFAASAVSQISVVFSMIAYAAGVISALFLATILVSRGLSWLDHPILEHQGEVITGLLVAVLGVLILILPHAHTHLD